MTIEFDDDCQTDDEIKERACASLMRELKGGIERYNKAKKTGEKVILNSINRFKKDKFWEDSD